MSAPRLRRAGAEDLGPVTALWLALGREHARLDAHWAMRDGAEREARELLRAMLRDPASRVVVAGDTRAGAARGAATPGSSALALCVTRIDEAPPILHETRRGEISDLWVEPHARRNGLGRALVEDAVSWLRASGVSRVEVRVAVRNEAGRAFWRALGFGAFVDVLDRRL